MLYYGIILFTLRKTSKESSEVDIVSKTSKESSEVDIVSIVSNGTVIKRKDGQLSDKIIKCDRIMIAVYVVVFTLYNIVYFIGYYSPGARSKLYVHH